MVTHECSRWYSKGHSIAPTDRVQGRHREDVTPSRNEGIEMRKEALPVSGRQGVRGSNPRCSTPSVANSILALIGVERQNVRQNMTPCLRTLMARDRRK